MNIIGKKYIWFAISLAIMVPGIVALILFGLNLSVEFTGGSKMSISFPQQVTEKEINVLKTNFDRENIEVLSIEPSGKTAIIRTKPIDEKQNLKFVNGLRADLNSAKQEEFSSIGPTIGKETTFNAIKAVTIASILVVVYISFVFRKVPKPASSIRFGISTILALLHDVLVVIGVFAILGYLFNVEIDALFVTALLTIIGFSVHDTIVVFDRIRENLEKKSAENFAQVVNDSILQTIGRSLNTSITVFLVLLALLLFGGESIKWFVVALIVGLASGTYSSIFTASPILVVWHEWSVKKKNKK